MAKSLFDKMFLKQDYSVVTLNLPKELEEELQSHHKVDNFLKGRYNFILAFYSKRQKLLEEAASLKSSLLPNGLLWIAYPKNKLLATDLNRDILHASMKDLGLDGVSLISLDSTWSAMRFKIVS